MLWAPTVQETEFKNNKAHLDTDNMITDFDTGEIICKKCGTVLQEKIVQSIKSDRVFTDNGGFLSSDTKSTIRFHDMALASVIDKFNHDSAGKPIIYEMKEKMRRMRVLDRRSQARTASERNLRTALGEMEKLKEKLSLSNAVVERAAYIYRKAAKADLIRGRRLNSMVAACVYIACREMNTTRTILEISKSIQESRKSIAKNYRILFRNLKISVAVPDPIRCIVKIANNLEMTENSKREAIQIFDILKERDLIAGKKPNAVAATVIYMAGIKTKSELSQNRISMVSGITSVTLRNRCKEYRKYISLD